MNLTENIGYLDFIYSPTGYGIGRNKYTVEQTFSTAAELLAALNNIDYIPWIFLLCGSIHEYYYGLYQAKILPCWTEEDKTTIINAGWDVVPINSINSLYNHDSAVETINSLPDCSGCAAQTIQFNGNSGSAYGKAINTLTDEEIAVATAKNWTVAIN